MCMIVVHPMGTISILYHGVHHIWTVYSLQFMAFYVFFCVVGPPPSPHTRSLYVADVSYEMGPYVGWLKFYFRKHRYFRIYHFKRRKHESMSPCIGNRVNTNCEPIASRAGVYYGKSTRNRDMCKWHIELESAAAHSNRCPRYLQPGMLKLKKTFPGAVTLPIGTWPWKVHQLGAL